MQRPDCFVCVDSKNRLGLYKMLGISERDVTVESYWETVVEPLLDTPWWQSERPSGDKDEETIWDGRVAWLMPSSTRATDRVSAVTFTNVTLALLVTLVNSNYPIV